MDTATPKTAAAGMRSDDTLRRFVGYMMKRTFNAVQADLARTLETYQLRMVTFSALVVVVDNPGLRQSELARALSVERPNLVVIVDELERRGLVVRAQVPTDRRAYALAPTKDGLALHRQALDAVLRHEEKILSGLNEDQVEGLITALGAVQKAAEA